jgi:hypothetical protein
MTRTRQLFTKLNLHFAALGVVLALDIFVGVRFALAWRDVGSDQSAAFAHEEIRYGQLDAQMKHLNGLPEKVRIADRDAQKFIGQRFAPNYSTLITQLDDTAGKNQVRLAHSNYSQQPAINGLMEVSIDAGLVGQYTDLMHFINDIERDKDHVFFIIDGITLSGQQGGLVNLRLRLTTYLRPGAGAPPPPDSGAQAAPGHTTPGQATASEGAQ